MKEKSMKKSEELNELIDLVVAGDSDAFRVLLEIYHPMLKKLLDTFATPEMSKEDIEDLAQERDTAFYRAITKFDKDRHVAFGLYAKICVTNSMISFKRATANRLNESLIGDEEMNNITDPNGEVPKFFAIRESTRILEEKIEETLSAYENKVWNFYVDGYSPKEIAKKLNLSEKSINNAIYRIKRKLKTLLIAD